MTNRVISPLKWVLLSTSMTAIGSVAVAGTTQSLQQDNTDAVKLTRVAESGESGEAGEAADGGAAREAGEAGEAGHSGEGADADFLADLGFIRGHLLAGYTLYKEGQADMAYTHMKHPGDEIYTDLLPELDERSVPGFGDQLHDLAEAIEHGADAAVVDEAFAAVAAALDAASAAEDNDHAKLRAIAALASTAAEEYAEGVVYGTLVELHEYQDAWGFIQIARAYAEELTGSDDAAVAKAARSSLEQLQSLDADFMGLVPPTEIGTDPSDLYVAAARIEFATVAMK